MTQHPDHDPQTPGTGTQGPDTLAARDDAPRRLAVAMRALTDEAARTVDVMGRFTDRFQARDPRDILAANSRAPRADLYLERDGTVLPDGYAPAVLWIAAGTLAIAQSVATERDRTGRNRERPSPRNPRPWAYISGDHVLRGQTLQPGDVWVDPSAHRRLDWEHLQQGIRIVTRTRDDGPMPTVTPPISQVILTIRVWRLHDLADALHRGISDGYIGITTVDRDHTRHHQTMTLRIHGLTRDALDDLADWTADQHDDVRCTGPHYDSDHPNGWLDLTLHRPR